jgi:hypothetical protein
MTEIECRAVGWIANGQVDLECCLPPGHEGKHWDQVEGWEW